MIKISLFKIALLFVTISEFGIITEQYLFHPFADSNGLAFLIKGNSFFILTLLVPGDGHTRVHFALRNFITVLQCKGKALVKVLERFREIISPDINIADVNARTYHTF